MNRQTLAAAFNLAYFAACPDGVQPEESGVILTELACFKLPGEENAAILNLYKDMTLEQAIEIIRNADEDTKDEAQALMIVTVCADGVVEVNEQEAFLAIYKRCNFSHDMSINEAHAKLGF